MKKIIALVLIFITITILAAKSIEKGVDAWLWLILLPPFIGYLTFLALRVLVRFGEKIFGPTISNIIISLLKYGIVLTSVFLSYMIYYLSDPQKAKRAAIQIEETRIKMEKQKTEKENRLNFLSETLALEGVKVIHCPRAKVSRASNIGSARELSIMGRTAKNDNPRSIGDSWGNERYIIITQESEQSDFSNSLLVSLDPDTGDTDILSNRIKEDQSGRNLRVGNWNLDRQTLLIDKYDTSWTTGRAATYNLVDDFVISWSFTAESQCEIVPKVSEIRDVIQQKSAQYRIERNQRLLKKEKLENQLKIEKKKKEADEKAKRQI